MCYSVRLLNSRSRLNDIQRIGGHPNVYLLEARLECLLKIPKELKSLWRIRDVKEYFDVFVRVSLLSVPSTAFNCLRFR